MVLKAHRSSVEFFNNDVVELILEILPPKSLLRFKSVSKSWKSTVESLRFQERQLIRRKLSRGADVLFVSIGEPKKGNDETSTSSKRIVLGSSIISTVKFPVPCIVVCHGSCDGLLCLTSTYEASFVINPATRWHRSFPLSNIQQLIVGTISRREYRIPRPRLGFGKDKFKGIYKPVWLYNSSEFGLDNVTTCEIFDFGTNAWRYVQPASPYRIISSSKPVYFDGSLHWFTECEETKVLSFDLHTEIFQVISKTPFAHVRHHPCNITMCVLDDRLCVSEKNWPSQVIWSMDSSGGKKTWEKMCSIDLTKTSSWFGEPIFVLSPIAIIDKNKLLLQAPGGGSHYLEPLVAHDLHTKSYDFLFTPITSGVSVCYLQSLFSL